MNIFMAIIAMIHISLSLHFLHNLSSPVSCFPTQEGTTALYVASQNGHSDIVKILLANGADVNIVGFVVFF